MGNLKYLLLLVLVSSVSVQSRKREQFHVIYEWNTFDFKWKDDSARQEAIDTGKYVKENVIVSGIKPYGDKLFLTLPRLKSGVPATMAWIPANPQPNATSPQLEPFPSWEANTIGDCKAFQSVQSVEIDATGTMWIIDNGRTNTINPANSTGPTCPPTLTLINLNSTDPMGSSFVRYTFPESVASNKSYLNDLVVDDSDSGHAFITDNSGADPGIIVFNRKDSKSWKMREPNSMRAARNAMMFTLNDVSTELNINVDGIALGNRYVRPDDPNIIDRNVYYCPLASYKLYSVSASLLKNESMATLPAELMSRYVMDMGVKPSQTSGMIIDEMGYLYYGLVGNHSIAQWNTATNFATEQHIIAKDSNFIQWADRFGIDTDGNLFVVINKLLNFVAGTVKPNEVNYRILKANIGAKSYMYGPPASSFKRPVATPGVSVQVNSPNSRDAQRTVKSNAGGSKTPGVSVMAALAFVFSFVFCQ